MKYQTISLFKFFCVKGAIYYVAIAKVIFSHVKISSFRAKARLVFHWCLYNKDNSAPQPFLISSHNAPVGARVA